MKKWMPVLLQRIEYVDNISTPPVYDGENMVGVVNFRFLIVFENGTRDKDRTSQKKINTIEM